MPRIIPLITLIFTALSLSCADRSLPLGPVRLRSPLALVVNTGDTLPMGFTLSDRSPIVALHVASWEARSATNPAGWLHDPTIDISDIPALRARFMAYADQSISVMNELGAKRMILWDGDGARYGVYIGCPDQTKRINPEIAGIIDDFMARFRAAGKIPGCTIRPEDLDEATGKLIPAADPYASLLRKATYANTQWKCRYFYIDSNYYYAPGTEQIVATLPASICARLHRKLTGCYFFPEQELVYGNGSVDLGYYQHAIPYLELRMNEPGTPAPVRTAVPGAFSVVFVSGADIRGNAEALRASVAKGDILLVNGWFLNQEITDVKAIYVTDPLAKQRARYAPRPALFNP